MSELDLSGVRIYSNTKDDARDALDLMDEEVYMSDNENFKQYCTCKLTGVQFTEDSSLPFLGYDGNKRKYYKYFILCKNAKFKEEEKEKVLRPFKDVEELTKVKNAIAALLESLSHYTGRYGVKAYWDSYEDYEKFYNSVTDACNIIEKELAKF